MKKIFVFFVASFAFLTMPIKAQIQLTPYVDATTGGVDKNNTEVIENRLRTLISRLGFESGYGTRFILAVKVNLLDRYIAPGAPPMIGQNMQVTMAVGDSESGVCYGSCTQEVKGRGQTENAAMLQGFRNIRITDELKSIIANAKTNILRYYDENGASLIAQARSLNTGQQYEEALNILAGIPRESSYYNQAATMMAQVYQSNINHDAQQIYNEASAIWAQDPNPGEAANEALRLLGTIDTQSKVYPQAKALINKINNRAQLIVDRQYADEQAALAHERNMERERLNAQTAIQQARIKSARDIAVAWAKSRPKVVYRTRIINRWWY